MRLQRRISLLERELKSLPMLHEPWFHVEHSPVQKPTTAPRSFLDQSMNLGINDLYGQERRQFGQGGSPCTCHLPANPSRRTFHSKRDPAGEGINLAKDYESIPTVPDQVFQPPSAKGSSAAEHIQSLQQAGLAGGIGSTDQSKCGIELEIHRLQAAEIRYLHPAQGHGIKASSASRHSAPW